MKEKTSKNGFCPPKFYEHDCIHKLDFCMSIVDFARFERLVRNENSYINIFIFL